MRVTIPRLGTNTNDYLYNGSGTFLVDNYWIPPGRNSFEQTMTSF